jgi:hypothetical protein
MSLPHPAPASTRHRLGVYAIVAALLATCGDLLLLWVTNAARPDLALPHPPRGALAIGTYLGVLAIPLFGVGYWHAAAGLAPGSPRAARLVFLLGAYGGAVGGVVHGLTGLIIHIERHAGTPVVDPFTALTPYRPYLLPLWGLLTVFLVVGSVLYALAITRRRTVYPRWMALLNPVLIVVALSAVGSTSPVLRAFLVPAGPNVAHVIFFVATTMLGVRDTE